MTGIYMVFDFRPLDEIENTELDQLVTLHMRERQRLEFKATLGLTGNVQNDHGVRQEVLVDIASLANAGGGYLIFGIGDDGRGQANGYSRLTEVEARRIRDTLTELVVRHISERIEGLEIRSRVVNGNHLVL
ncbi:MAG: ATP-binding protein, partial [Cyanobacteria bacterium]|nr:ATP-binding protein [Cyanobacteriota bacterium]